MPQGVAVLDTPDIDSVVEAHRQFAKQFLDASDLWLFVTTARRYADAVVWEMLKDGRDRGASLGLVLSRVPPAAASQLTDHFDAMVQANGLGGTQRFVIPETTVIDARLPAAVSEPVRLWLKDTARRDERRVAILTQTMAGVLGTFERRVPALAAQAEMQLALRRELSSGADAAYQAGLAELDEAIRSGSLLRGEVLARWQDFAGTGDLIRTLEVRKGRSLGQAVPPARPEHQPGAGAEERAPHQPGGAGHLAGGPGGRGRDGALAGEPGRRWVARAGTGGFLQGREGSPGADRREAFVLFACGTGKASISGAFPVISWIWRRRCQRAALTLLPGLQLTWRPGRLGRSPDGRTTC